MKCLTWRDLRGACNSDGCKEPALSLEPCSADHDNQQLIRPVSVLQATINYLPGRGGPKKVIAHVNVLNCFTLHCACGSTAVPIRLRRSRVADT